MSYENYLKDVEKWFNNGIQPNDTNISEYNETATADLDMEKLSPYAYTKEVKKIKEFLKTELTVKLKDCADIIIPLPHEELIKVDTLTVKNFEYPINYNKITQGWKTKQNYRLQKGDIIIYSHGEFSVYLIDEDPKIDLYLTSSYYVIKAKNGFCPEYLYLYLKSKTAKIILSSMAHRTRNESICAKNLYETEKV